MVAGLVLFPRYEVSAESADSLQDRSWRLGVDDSVERMVHRIRQFPSGRLEIVKVMGAPGRAAIGSVKGNSFRVYRPDELKKLADSPTDVVAEFEGGLTIAMSWNVGKKKK